MSSMFRELIQGSRRIGRDEFATTFGGIADDVIEMLDSEQAREATRQAREYMESAESLIGGRSRLRQVEFGLFSDAPELEKGEVSSIDGTPTLPLQMYSSVQALCVGVGSISTIDDKIPTVVEELWAAFDVVKGMGQDGRGKV